MIMANAKEDDASEDNDAVERLLFKIILSQTLVGEECDAEKVRLSQEFWDSHKLFQNRDRECGKNHI